MTKDQLVRTVQVSDSQTMAIYRLTDEQASKYSCGKLYMLKCNEYSDYVYNRWDDDRLVHIEKAYYEGFFTTEQEAYLTAMLVKANDIIDQLRHDIMDLNATMKSVAPDDFTWEIDEFQ